MSMKLALICTEATVHWCRFHDPNCCRLGMFNHRPCHPNWLRLSKPVVAFDMGGAGRFPVSGILKGSAKIPPSLAQSWRWWAGRHSYRKSASAHASDDLREAPAVGHPRAVAAAAAVGRLLVLSVGHVVVDVVAHRGLERGRQHSQRMHLLGQQMHLLCQRLDLLVDRVG